MKKFIIATLILFYTLSSQAQMAIGGGIGYNQKVSSVGLTVKGEFNITEQIAITPNVSYFFGSSRFIGYNQSLLGIDVNATYAFNIIEKLKIYPIVGANFSSYKTRDTFLFIADEDVENETAFGANIGAGAQWQFTEKLSVYLEPKYVASNYSQIIVNAGVLLKL